MPLNVLTTFAESVVDTQVVQMDVPVPLNVLTIFAGIFLVMGLIADVISLVGEYRRVYQGGKRQVIPMVGVVFYMISCFVGYLYLDWEVAAVALALLVVFHLVCQYTFFFIKRPEA